MEPLALSPQGVHRERKKKIQIVLRKMFVKITSIIFPSIKMFLSLIIIKLMKTSAAECPEWEMSFNSSWVSMLLLLILHCFKSLTDLIYLFRSTDISGRKKQFLEQFSFKFELRCHRQGEKKKHKDTFTTQKYIKISTENINLSRTDHLHKEQSSSSNRSQ